jgi:hypothetical protein
MRRHSMTTALVAALAAGAAGLVDMGYGGRRGASWRGGYVGNRDIDADALAEASRKAKLAARNGKRAGKRQR